MLYVLTLPATRCARLLHAGAVYSSGAGAAYRSWQMATVGADAVHARHCARHYDALPFRRGFLCVHASMHRGAALLTRFFRHMYHKL